MTNYLREQMVKKLHEEDKDWNNICKALGHGCHSVICMSKPAFSLTGEYSVDCLTGIFNDYYVAQDWAVNTFNDRCKHSEVVVVYCDGDLYRIKDEEK